MVRDFLAAMKDVSWLDDHIKSFFVLNRDLRRDATALLLEDSWFTMPMKERSSVRFVATGYFMMASVMVGSICSVGQVT